MGAFDHLPDAIRVLLPEVTGLDWPEEQHADCARCPMVKPSAEPWGFSPGTRCCTANPSLANFLAGRALRRGEPGRGKILARLEDPSGVTPWGIDPPPEHDATYKKTIVTAFGRDESLLCPMWVGGELSCGIWHDRSSTCRTWYCKHDDGLAGAVAWSRMSMLLSEVESRLAIWAIEHGDAPTGAATPPEWAAWFERAAALIDRVTEPELEGLVSDGLLKQRAHVAEFVEVRRLRRRPMTDVMVAAVSEMTRVGADVLITGYSSFDAIRVPAAVFELLQRLDGVRPWRVALIEARAALELRGEPTGWLEPSLVFELHRVGALRDPAGRDDLPYGVEMVDMDRWSRAAERIP